jgi:hypothetical protein
MTHQRDEGPERARVGGFQRRRSPGTRGHAWIEQ